ncbi:MAG TPA: hypothetical protein VFO18_12320 [Methylomirabilota bacterium]|nr:hypothetical protein [Methylomirabilota bacterium]
MLKIASVTLGSFLLALLAVVGLDAYTASRPGIDESGVLSTPERVAELPPDPARHAKKPKIHRLRVCAIPPILSPEGRESAEPSPPKGERAG